MDLQGRSLRRQIRKRSQFLDYKLKLLTLKKLFSSLKLKHKISNRILIQNLINLH